MIKVDVRELTKGIKKVMSINARNSSIRLDVKHDAVTLYYSDGHDILVDTVPAEADDEQVYIINAPEADRILNICQPGAGLEVDPLSIIPNDTEHTLTFRTKKRLAAGDKAGADGTAESAAETDTAGGEKKAKGGIRINQVIGYRSPGESKKDMLLTSTDYSTLWLQDRYDVWDKTALIAYLKAMLSAGGRIILYATQNQLMYTQSPRVVMLHSIDSDEHVYGIALTASKAKTLVDILSRMRADTVQVSNNLSNAEETEKRILFVSDETSEGYACTPAAVTKQDLRAYQYFSAVDKVAAEMTANKHLLQDVISSMSGAGIEQCSAGIKTTDGAAVLTLTDAVRTSDFYDVYLDSASDRIQNRTFTINIKSLLSMFQHFRGDSISVSLFDSTDGVQNTSYLKVADADSSDVIFFMAAGVTNGDK